MYKVYSVCLLLTSLVFSSAHAPTFQLWRELATASADTSADPVSDYLDSHASFFATDPFAATREFSEDSDLNRFGLDEFNLPTLDVDLPQLFNWSDGERSYLANNTLPSFFEHSLDNATSIAFRSGGASIGYAGTSGFNIHPAGGAAGASPSVASAGLASKSASTSGSNESVVALNDDAASTEDAPNVAGNDTQPTENQLAKNEPVGDIVTPLDQVLLPSDPVSYIAPVDYTIVDAQKPVQVPTPGAFGLFVLGLAGLRLVGRKKNGSG